MSFLVVVVAVAVVVVVVLCVERGCAEGGGHGLADIVLAFFFLLCSLVLQVGVYGPGQELL